MRGCVLATLALTLCGVARADPLPGAPPVSTGTAQQLARAASAVPPGEARTRHLDGDGRPRFTNRLVLEASPYLRQHAHNPVNWFPWGDEAFALARELDRPVLVSIGYSTCHWCHVMEEESFDDVETARLLNEGFITIKVDRETRPDVDAIYMQAQIEMNGSGGWPLNVFVTPEREPFYGGTYFPPEDSGQRPSFRRVLGVIRELYTQDPARVRESARGLAAQLRAGLRGVEATRSLLPGPELIERSVAGFLSAGDREWGGIRSRHKFPSSLPVRLLLRHHHRSGDRTALDLAVLTLEKMAAGGLRDHVGGGFHRYSVDPRWLVPHFEKMLYDNALLALAYLDGWQVTGREDFAAITRQTLDYVLREMTAPGGGFYSATDADSPGPDGESEEGRFFTWTPQELGAALSPADARAIALYHGVTAAGNLEGRTVLHAWRDPADVARELGTSLQELGERLERARKILYEVRAGRPAPLRDEKILTAWNGLMISALARAGFALDAPHYLEAARRAAAFLLDAMRAPDGRLLRARARDTLSGDAFLEDHAFAIAGLLDLHEASGETRWLEAAIDLQARLDARHADDAGGGYWRTAHDAEVLLVREKPARDGAVPSGNSVAAHSLLRLAELTGDPAYRQRALMLFAAFDGVLRDGGGALPVMLAALDAAHRPTRQVFVVVPGDGRGAAPLIETLRPSYGPVRQQLVVPVGEPLRTSAARVPALRDKRALGGRATAYVCEGRICEAPTSDPARLARLLEAKTFPAPPAPDAMR